MFVFCLLFCCVDICAYGLCVVVFVNICFCVVQSLSRDKAFQSDASGNQVLKGHRNLVSSLSVSMDGTLLLSGSHDETVRLWDIQSKQSIRCLAHKGKLHLHPH
ncbi:hypothetical protein LDENG_00262940 [Lucifuga dentata]|nr:hypothetical protein LDENG_00262940 [Lucifuga dentata]